MKGVNWNKQSQQRGARTGIVSGEWQCSRQDRTKLCLKIWAALTETAQKQRWDVVVSVLCLGDHPQLPINPSQTHSQSVSCLQDNDAASSSAVKPGGSQPTETVWNDGWKFYGEKMWLHGLLQKKGIMPKLSEQDTSMLKDQHDWIHMEKALCQ